MTKVERIMILAKRMKIAERFRNAADSLDEYHLFGSMIDQFKADVQDLIVTLTPGEAMDLVQSKVTLD